jgi:hypothetical protein
LGDILQAFHERHTPSSPSPKSKRPSDHESASAPQKTPKRLRPTLDDKKTSKAIPNTVKSAVEVHVKGPTPRQKAAHEPSASAKIRKPRTCITCRQTGCKGSFNRKLCLKWVDPAGDKSDVTPTSAVSGLEAIKGLEDAYASSTGGITARLRS